MRLYEHIFDQALERLHSEGRYRVFIDILQQGCLPQRAVLCGP